MNALTTTETEAILTLRLTALYQEALLNKPAVAARLLAPGARSGMPKISLRLFSESGLPGKRGEDAHHFSLAG